MLYYLARRYDELPGEDVSVGSTARGGMKAWHKHGACRLRYWESIDQDPISADPEWQAYLPKIRPLIVTQETRIHKCAPFFLERLKKMLAAVR